MSGQKGGWVESDRKTEKDMLHEAIEFAAVAHNMQVRKGTDVPYIVHPFEVAQILAAHGCSRDMVVAGLLHDTVEDAGVTLDDIRDMFGEQAARLVAGCSEDKTGAWEQRKQHTIDYLTREAETDVMQLTCADKLSNMRCIRADHAKIGEMVWERFRRGKEQQKWYYGSLIGAMSPLAGQPMYEELKWAFGTVFTDDSNL